MPRTTILAVLAVITLPVAGSAQSDRVESSLVPISLPEPWGEHAVGVRTAIVLDSDRRGNSSPDDTYTRQLLVRVWYPAVHGGAVRPYMRPEVADAWRATLPVPRGWEAAVATNSYENAPPSSARERWPVLLFSHGRSFPIDNYQILLEHLASSGWVVAAISHPGEEALTLLPDGTRIPFDGPRWEDEADRGEVLMSVVDEMVLDAVSVLNWLEAAAVTAGDPFHDRLALAAGVGYAGHSLGGAAAVWTASREPRVVAAASWEGQVYRDEDRPLNVSAPTLYLIGGANREALAGRQFRGGGIEAPLYEVVIHGAWHASVGDLLHVYRSYAPRDWQERHRREATALRVNQITGDLLHAFFSRHLLGARADLLEPDGTDEEFQKRNYPEVELRMSVDSRGLWSAR